MRRHRGFTRLEGRVVRVDSPTTERRPGGAGNKVSRLDLLKGYRGHGLGHPRVTATSVTFAGRTQTCFALTPEISKKRLVWIARKTQLSATEMRVVVLGVEADVHRCKVDIAPSTLDWVRRRKASCPT